MKKSSAHQPKQPESKLGLNKAELELLRQKTVDLASQSPQKAATILSDWLNGQASRPTSRKKTG